MKNFRTIYPKLTTGDQLQLPKQSVRKESQSREYKCCDCKKSHKSFRQLKAHEKICQKNGKDNICNYCCSLFANAEMLEKHKTEKHPDSKYICAQCTKRYLDKGHLLKHMREIHQRETFTYLCTLCTPKKLSPREFETRNALQEHFMSYHLQMSSKHFEDISGCAKTNDDGGEDSDIEMLMDEEFLDDFLEKDTSFDLSDCFDEFDIDLPAVLQISNSKSININANASAAIAYKCPKCFDDCINTRTLMNHLLEVHDYNKPNKCVFCYKEFNTSINLKQHLRFVHSLNKRHICQLCDRQFASLDHLKKHVQSQHQNERRHICHVCAKAFTQLCHLKQHLLIHTTGKCFQCEFCSATFWRRIDLQRHTLKEHQEN